MNPVIPEQDDMELTAEPRSSSSTQRQTVDHSDENASVKEESSGKKFMSLSKKSKKNSTSSDGKEKKPFLEAFSSKLASFAH
jgi:hypothetical protein